MADDVVRVPYCPHEVRDPEGGFVCCTGEQGNHAGLTCAEAMQRLADRVRDAPLVPNEKR